MATARPTTGKSGRPATGRPSHHPNQSTTHSTGAAENTRTRARRRKAVVRAPAPAKLHSAFPWMNYPESVVQETLMQLKVPFEWHAFSGNAPDFTQLMAGYAPTFTLPDYRAAIFVISPYFGGIPGVLDKASLAIALLQVDWWHTVILYDHDILEGRTLEILEREVPDLKAPHILGPEIPNPNGDVAVIAKKRQTRLTRKRRSLNGKHALVGGIRERRKPHRNSSTDTGERRRRRGSATGTRAHGRGSRG